MRYSPEAKPEHKHEHKHEHKPQSGSIQPVINPNQALYNLYAITGDPSHLSTGRRFNHYQWTAPLAIGVDVLDGSHGNWGGNHANTHLPEIVGSARGYELTGNVTQMAIATNFFNILTAGANESWDPSAPGGHTFATGGSNAAEHWFAAATLADSLQPNRWVTPRGDSM